MSILRETITEIADATRGRAGTSELIPTMGIAEKIRGLAGPGEVISDGERYEVESVETNWMFKAPSLVRGIVTALTNSITMVEDGNFIITGANYITRYSADGTTISKTYVEPARQNSRVRFLKNSTDIIILNGGDLKRVRADGTVVYSIERSIMYDVEVDEAAGYLYYTQHNNGSYVYIVYLNNGGHAGAVYFTSLEMNFIATNPTMRLSGARIYLCSHGGIACINARSPFNRIWLTNLSGARVQGFDVIDNDIYYCSGNGVGAVNTAGNVTKPLQVATEYAATDAYGSALYASSDRDSFYVAQNIINTDRKYKTEILKLDLDLNLLYRLPLGASRSYDCYSFGVFENRIVFPIDYSVSIYRDNMLKKTIATLKNSGGGVL